MAKPALIYRPVIMVIKLTDLMVRGIMYGQVLLIVLAAITGAGLLVGVLDRRPPFAIHPHERIPVYAGTLANIDVPVMRDISRPCDASYSRFLYDANESRVDLSAGFMSFEEIKNMSAGAPDRLKIKVPIPPIAASGVYGGVAQGHGRIASELEYVCNKGHMFFSPIKVHADILIDIRP